MQSNIQPENSSGNKTRPAPRRLVPKLCGADIELANFIIGPRQIGSTCYDASRALLREIEGHPKVTGSNSSSSGSWGNRGSQSLNYAGDEDSDYSYYSTGCHGSYGSGYRSSASGYDSGYGYGYNPQDYGRKYLPSNGGCVYIDLDHLEVCLPEVLSAYDHVAAWHALLRLVRKAQVTANEKLDGDQKIQVLINNTDGKGNSYGSHLNFLISKRAWVNLFHRKIHHMLYLAAYQVSSIIFTGQGKVGSENGKPSVPYQITQRGDFFETLSGVQTTYCRPLVNSRHEDHCGSSRSRDENPSGAEDLSRLHCIFYDNTLCPVASLLKVGVMQIILCLIEAEQIRPDLMVDDPVNAVVRWSHDPTLQTKCRMANGKRLTAVELQLLFLEQAKPYVEAGRFDSLVPQARSILELWEDTLLKLQAYDLDALSPRLDWVLKYRILESAQRQQSRLDWKSPEIKYLDHLYSSLDPSEGLYWAYESSGQVEKVVCEERIEHFLHEPPKNTRAWTRAMLLRQAEPGQVESVDWDSIRFKFKGSYYWPRYRSIELADPLGFTQLLSEPVFQENSSLESILDALGVPQTNSWTSTSAGSVSTSQSQVSGLLYSPCCSDHPD